MYTQRVKIFSDTKFVLPRLKCYAMCSTMQYKRYRLHRSEFLSASNIQSFFQHPTSTFINTSNHNTRLDMTHIPKGFPSSWLNDQGHVKCVARGCDQVWKTPAELRFRHRHLHLQDILAPQTETDHNILLAMNKQRKCPYCHGYPVREGKSVTDLHQHVLKKHGREDTATISGFVKLLRCGKLEPEVARLAYEPIHQRLLQGIMVSPDYGGSWGLAKFWHIGDKDPRVNMRVLESIITTPNQKEGKPLDYPMKSDDFLRDLPPQFIERQIAYNWAGMRARLRQMYANGEI